MFGDLGARIKTSLSGDVSMEEIKRALFNIGAMKSPGEDGLPAAFYHRYWDLCNFDIVQFIQGCFRMGVIDPSLNSTLIALVPLTRVRCLTLDQSVFVILCIRLLRRSLYTD